MTNAMTRSGTGRRRFGGERRGIALMLVVIAMGTATVMTTAFLLSKDNSAAIGENAHDTAASEWTAKSGAEVALAILQTDAVWADEDPAKLLESFSIAGGTVSVALSDLNGQAPIGEETELAMTVVAEVNGVRTVLQRIVTMQPDMTMEESIDPEYGEFGIFAEQSIAVELGSNIAPWHLSPKFKSGSPVKVTAAFTDSASLAIDADTEMASTNLYVRPDSASTLQEMINSGHFAGGEVLQMVLPTLVPRLPMALGDEMKWTNATPMRIENTFSSTTLPEGRYADVRVSNTDVTVTLDDAGSGQYRFKNLEVINEAVLTIKGNVIVCVDEKFGIANGATVVLADDASRVRFYVGGDICVDAAAIGVQPAIAQAGSIEVTDLTEYVHPKRIRMFSLPTEDGGIDGAYVRITNESVTMFSLIAPNKNVLVDSGSTLIGRATGKNVCIKDGSALLYDPILDHGAGFTAFNGPLYKDNGEPQDGLAAALGTYDTTQGLDGFTAHMMGKIFEEVDAVPFVPPGDPDPRSADRAIKKPWPFVAMAIEEGNVVAGDNSERQESLYVALDETDFDVDQFYNDGLIVATYTKTSNVIEDVVDDVVEVIEDVGEGVGGLLGGVGGLLGGG